MCIAQEKAAKRRPSLPCPPLIPPTRLCAQIVLFSILKRAFFPVEGAQNGGIKGGAGQGGAPFSRLFLGNTHPLSCLYLTQHGTKRKKIRPQDGAKEGQKGGQERAQRRGEREGHFLVKTSQKRASLRLFTDYKAGKGRDGLIGRRPYRPEAL